MEDYTVTELRLDDSFRFACNPEVPCFNQCCGDLVQFLTPYDILRLKQNLNLTSSEFLARYTRRHMGGETGLIVVSLKNSPDTGNACPFVSPEGCRVYHDRPSSCRSYPLARVAARSRDTGAIAEKYLLMKEPHCHGFEQDQRQTVRQWVEEQGLLPYNAMNDRLMEIISAKNRLAPGEPLDLASGNIFYTGCYDLDRFTEEIVRQGRLAEAGLDGGAAAAAGDDEEKMLELALTWVYRMLFVDVF